MFRPTNTLELKKGMYTSKLKAKPKLIQSDSGSSFISEANSFLQETEHNSDIDHTIRDEIEDRFSKSPVNASYKFPRNNERLPKLSQSPRRTNFPYIKHLDISMPKPTTTPKQFDSFISINNKLQYSTSKSPTHHYLRNDTKNVRITSLLRRIQTPVLGTHINRRNSKVRHSRSGSDLEKLLETIPLKTMKLAKTIKFRPRSRATQRNESPVFKLSSKTPSPSRFKLMQKKSKLM